jgi:hypothetical protein
MYQTTMDNPVAGNTMSTIGRRFASEEQLNEFTVFPKLPTELRLETFKHALPIGPEGFRMLKVYYSLVNPEEKRKRKGGRKTPSRKKSKPGSKPKSSMEFILWKKCPQQRCRRSLVVPGLHRIARRLSKAESACTAH